MDIEAFAWCVKKLRYSVPSRNPNQVFEKNYTSTNNIKAKHMTYIKHNPSVLPAPSVSHTVIYVLNW
jgi:hypothetical protein